MLTSFLKRLKYFGIAVGFIGLVSIPVLTFAASQTLPDVVALFTTSLQSPITSSQTTMTLVSSAYNAGNLTLASSTYGFIIDEGTSIEEIVSADCTGTTCTNMQRGIDRYTGTTTRSYLQFTHRRGASVKITNAPVLLVINRILQGIGTIPNPLSYTSHPTFTATTQVVDKKYVDDTAFSGAGVIDATTAARGVVELATGAEAAASTAAGSSGNLAIPATVATSTYNSATAGNVIPVTDLTTKKVDYQFIATSTGLFKNAAITGTSTIATTTIDSFKINNPQFVTDTGGNALLWSFLASTTFNNTTGLASVNVPARTFMKIFIYLTGSGGGEGIDLSFNGDFGVNYAYYGTSSSNTNASGVGTQGIRLGGNNGIASRTGPKIFTIDVFNFSTTTKTVMSNVAMFGPGATATTTVPTMAQEWGIWATTTSQLITSIQASSTAVGSIGIAPGSLMYVYGSAF